MRMPATSFIHSTSKHTFYLSFFPSSITHIFLFFHLLGLSLKKVCYFSLLPSPRLQIHGHNVGQACLGGKVVAGGGGKVLLLLLLSLFLHGGKQLRCTHQEVDESLLCHQWRAPYRPGIWSAVGFSFGFPLALWKVLIFPYFLKIWFSWWILNVLEHGTECWVEFFYHITIRLAWLE